MGGGTPSKRAKEEMLRRDITGGEQKTLFGKDNESNSEKTKLNQEEK